MKIESMTREGMFALLLCVAVGGCSESVEGPSRGERLTETFLRAISNGPELVDRGAGESSTAWVCTPRIAEGEFALRYFDDGQMIIGFGPEEEVHEWVVYPGSPDYGSEIEFPRSPEWLSTTETDDETHELYIQPGQNILSFDADHVFLNLRLSLGRLPTSETPQLDGIGLDELDCELFDEQGESLSFPNSTRAYSAAYNPLGRDIDPMESESPGDDGSSESIDDEPSSSSDEATPSPSVDGNDDENGAANDAGDDVPDTVQPVSSLSADQGASGSRVLSDLQGRVEDIWYVGEIGDVVSLASGLSTPFYSVVEFENGDVSLDGTSLSEEGERASRRAHPELWGEGRVRGGTFGFRLEGERTWREPEFAVRTESRGRGSTLAGCFGSSPGSIVGPMASISFRSLCLDADGRFALDSATSTSGGAGAGTASSSERGSYVIDERAIRLEYDDGQAQELLFGVYVEGDVVEAIVLGSRVLDAN